MDEDELDIMERVLADSPSTPFLDACRSTARQLRAVRKAVNDETTWLDRAAWKHAMNYVSEKMKSAKGE